MTAPRDRSVPLQTRLISAFVLISLIAVGGLLLVEEVGLGSVLDQMNQARRAEAATEVAGLVAEAYRRSGGWAEADLAHAQHTAEGVGAWLSIDAADGTRLLGAPTGVGPDGSLGVDDRSRDVVTVPIRVDDAGVGTARLWFLSEDAAVHRAHHYVWGWALMAGTVALVAAWVTGLVVARRLATPLTELTQTAQRYAAGDHRVRAHTSSRVWEVVQLAAAFDSMAEAVERSEESQQRVVADIAHELRNPLAVLQGDLEEMRDGLVPADAASIGALHTEVQRLSRVVGDLGALAEAEQPAVLRPRSVDLAAVVDQAARARSTAFDAAAIALAVRAEGAEGATVWGDDHRLGQVTGNLLDNCLRHCRPGDTCTVSVGRNDGHVDLVVEDTGPGIAPDDLGHVFERRFRGASARGPGSGIGLAVVRELVSAHGGAVDVRSRPGAGTRVQVRLPVSPVGEQVG